jgi:hypothetical protein
MATRFLASLAILATACTGFAQIHYTSNGFEPPTFVTGSIAGQDGWIQGWSSGNSVSIVAGAGPTGGTQHARSHWNVSGISSTTRNVPGWLVFNDGFSFSADMRLDASMLVPPQANQLFIAGVAAAAGTSGSSFPVDFALLAFKGGQSAGTFAGANLSGKEGYLLTDNVSLAVVFETPLDTQWHHLRVHYHLPSDSFMGYVDGTQILSRQVVGYQVLGFSGVTLVGNRFNTTSSAFVDFDNAVAAVPEPTTVATLSLGLLLLRRNRRSRA